MHAGGDVTDTLAALLGDWHTARMPYRADVHDELAAVLAGSNADVERLNLAAHPLRGVPSLLGVSRLAALFLTYPVPNRFPGDSEVFCGSPGRQMIIRDGFDNLVLELLGVVLSRCAPFPSRAVSSLSGHHVRKTWRTSTLLRSGRTGPDGRPASRVVWYQ